MRLYYDGTIRTKLISTVEIKSVMEMPTYFPCVCDQCSVALFCVVHVVETFVIGVIISAGWHVTYGMRRN